MGNKLIITKENNKIISALFEDRDMLQVSLNLEEKSNILENIYIGKVKNIIKNINAAFIEISPDLICYYSLNDNNHPICSNHSKIKIGDELVVQVIKESIKNKAPMVSSKIELVGKYIVLIYGKPQISVSSKILETQEKNRLKNILLPYLHDDFGFIIRTNAENISDDKLMNEAIILINEFNKIKEYCQYKKCFSTLYTAPINYICDIRDVYASFIDEFITDDKDIFDNIHQYLSKYQKEDLLKLRLYQDNLISLNSFYGIHTKIENALKPVVWLNSGGSIVIQHTEALTVIDVNTGKAISGKKDAETTFLKINMEATKEIAKQMRLRNLSGIIIIDFIDMKSRENKELVMKELDKFLKSDPVKANVIDMTSLGLVEVTRKKIRKPLFEQFYDNE